MFKRALIVLEPDVHPGAALLCGMSVAGSRLTELVLYTGLLRLGLAAVDLPDHDMAARADGLPDQRQHAERLHRQARETADEHGVLSRSVIAATDDPARDILATADTSHSELIVVCHDGSNAIVRLMNGSVIPGLVTASQVPVMVCAAAPAMAPAMRRILVVLEDLDATGVALTRALALARSSGAELLFVHIRQEDLVPVVDSMGFVADTPEGLADDIQRLSHRLLASAMAVATKARLASRGISLPAGTTARDIARIAEEQVCELILVAHHGSNALLRLLTGSLIPGLITASMAPVLICPTPERPPLRRPSRRRHRHRVPAATATQEKAHDGGQ